MKRVGLGLFMALSVFASAAPVGNPAFPKLLQKGGVFSGEGRMNLRIGYEGDFVGDGKLAQADESSTPIDDERQETNSGSIVLTFVDRLDLYGVLGSSRFCLNWRFNAEENTIKRVQLETRYGCLWAAGARAILYEWGKAVFGMGGRYGKTDMAPSWIAIDGIPAARGSASLNWEEWQVDANLSYQIDLLTPYLGAKYSQVHACMGEFAYPIANRGAMSMSMKNRHSVGLVVGCTVTNGHCFMLNIEGRLIDEQALSIFGELRF